jgi:hypothetical protein
MNKKMLLAVQVGLILLISGVLGGMLYYTDIYDDVESGIVRVLCLSCIKLKPITSRDFTFDTANGRDHPDFVIDTLKNKGPILILYSEPGCTGCNKIIDEVMDPYFHINFTDKSESFETEVTIENISFYFYYIYIDVDAPKTEKTESFWIYDKDHISGLPMSTIITIEYSHGGDIKPYYSSLYSSDFEPTAKKKYEVFVELLKFSNELYDRNIVGFKKTTVD